MKTITYLSVAAALGYQSALATVNYVGDDWTTGSHWRTPSVIKTNDIDGDNIYGSEGYYLPSGLDSDAGNVDLNPFLTASNIITGNPYEINTLPSYIRDLEYTDPTERGQSWGGARDEEGTLDLVPGGFTGLTGAGILLEDLTATNMSLTLQLSNAPAFRLTLIFGNTASTFPPNTHGDPLGYDSGYGMNVTLNDGGGAVGPEESGDSDDSLATNTTGYTTYQSWDIQAGTTNLQISIAPYNGTDIPRLSGLAIDSLPPVAPSILTQPQGSTNFAGSPISLSVTAVGTALTYQWLKNSSSVPGATSWNLTLLDSVTTNSGSYQVVVSNSINSITSAPAVVDVIAIPTTVIYEDSLSNNSGAPLNGRTPDTTDTAGAVWSSDTNWLMSGSNTYVDQSTNGFNGNAWLPFTPVPGRIYTLSAVLEDEYNMAVDTTDEGPGWAALGFTDSITDTNAYWWQYNPYGWLLARDNGDTLDNQYFVGPDTANGGDTGVYSTGPATYTIILNTTATNSANWTFTFLVNGAVVRVATAVGGSGPVIGAVGIGSLNDASQVSSFSLGEQIPPSAPFITQQPASGTPFVGGSFALTTEGGGSVPLTYQWLRNSQPVSGATNADLTLTNLSVTNGGEYQVIYSNPLGSLTSMVAVVEVSEVLVTNTIYLDHFVGNPGPLNGRAPDTFGAPNTWIATNWQANGIEATNDQVGNAFLPFTPLSGRIYTLSASLEDLGGSGWLALGFNQGDSVLDYWHVGGGNGTVGWWLIRPDGEGDPNLVWPEYANGGAYYDGNFSIGSPNTGGQSNCASVLDTTGGLPSAWTVSFIEGGTVVFGPFSSVNLAAAAPTILFVGMGTVTGNTDILTVSNFSLTAISAPPPALQVTGGSGTVRLSWSPVPAGYTLYSASNLGTPTAWSPVTNTPVQVGALYQVTLHESGTQAFYRLQSLP